VNQVNDDKADTSEFNFTGLSHNLWLILHVPFSAAHVITNTEIFYNANIFKDANTTTYAVTV
jgi:hypothetical protein